MMFPTPKGYISIPDAVDRVLRALHGEPEIIPWRGKDLDQAVLDSGRAQATEAQEWLIVELSAGRLVAEIGNVEVPTEYWTCNGAHTTAHTGCLEPPEISASDYAELAYRPCFIEREIFEARLSTIGGRQGRKPGDGAYDDKASLKKMARLIKTGRAKSVHEAAGIVAPDVAGGGTWESKARRLCDKWKQTHG